MSTTEAHRFESAGLGPAPYNFLRVEERRGPIRTVLASGVTVEVGAPGQPMSCCDYCSTGIAYEFWLRAADGREFKVGSDCIAKAGDASLKRAIAPALKAHRNGLADERIAAARARLDQASEALAAKPHPYQWAADQGKTALDFVTWMLAHAGRSGKIKAARMVEGA